MSILLAPGEIARSPFKGEKRMSCFCASEPNNKVKSRAVPESEFAQSGGEAVLSGQFTDPPKVRIIYKVTENQRGICVINNLQDISCRLQLQRYRRIYCRYRFVYLLTST